MEQPGYNVILNDFSQEEYESGGAPADQLNTERDIFFLVYTYVPVEVATIIANKLKTVQDIVCSLGTSQRAGYKDVHITNSAATKEHAIAELLTRLNVDRQNTWGFGDALNDVHFSMPSILK
jgi:hydroxymethylpyrimidine pyrophosphatase-like HAD family hydrolase